MYMRHVEPWLDATGWGTTWPSLRDKYPDLTQQEHTNTGPTSPQSHRQSYEGDEDGGGEDSKNITDTSELEDNDGEDPERLEDSNDDDSNKDTSDGGSANKRIHPRDGEDEGRGDDTEDEAEGHHL